MFRFRLTLMVLLGGLVLLTVATVGVSSYLNSRAAAHELSGQVLEQTAQRIDEQVEKLLGEATGPCSLTVQMMKSGQLPRKDPVKLIGYWRDVLTVQPELTALFIGQADTGDSIGISRLQRDQLSIWQTERIAATAKYALREYRAQDFPNAPFKMGQTEEDSRTRPWFRAAAKAGRGTWTPGYVFLGVGGIQNVLGVTYAAPVQDSKGDLQAVVMADFDLETLSRFLAGLRIGQRGSAFLVEVRDEGLRVIAHPRSEMLVRDSKTGGPRELSPLEDLDDERVRAFLRQLPANAATDTAGDSKAIRFEADGERFLGSYHRVVGESRPRWLICTFLPEGEVLAYAERSNRETAMICFAVLALAILASVYLARQVAQPLEHLASDAAAAGQLRLESRPPIRSIVREVDQLAKATEEMKSGLRSFEKYLPADLVRGLLASGQEAHLGGESRVLTISFSDIVGFSSIAESMADAALVAHLGEYLEQLSEIIHRSGGTVDKFIGDAIMAFWGAPVANPQHARAACLAAYRCQRRLRELRPEWEASGRPALRTRFGLHTGQVLVGNIGSPARMNYTVMGDAVNLASRLEGLNKYYGTEILLSEKTYREAAELLVVRPLDLVAVAGRAEAVPIYELMGLVSEVEPGLPELAERYAEAFRTFQNRDWGRASTLLDDYLRLRPDDGPAKGLAKRCRQFLQDPPESGWDGVNRMTSK